MKTYKQLQDDVLSWMADAEDDGLMRDLVKLALNASHKKILTSMPWDFMLWPEIETLSVSASERFYTLHPLYHRPLFFFNTTTKEYLEEVPQSQIIEAQTPWYDGEQSDPERFSITTLNHVANQPATAATVSVATTGGTESSSNSVVVTGIVSGEVREETLSSGSAWSSLTGSLSFSKIISITKVGATWTRTITVSCGATTILSLLSTEFGKQYRQLELLSTPTNSASILYRFYATPRTLTRDNDIPQVPAEFSDLLVLDTLTKMQGYTRATGDEMVLWKSTFDELLADMRAAYQTARAIGARPKFIMTLPRF